jgi:type II secretory pathway pseudopilin PulG
MKTEKNFEIRFWLNPTGSSTGHRGFPYGPDPDVIGERNRPGRSHWRPADEPYGCYALGVRKRSAQVVLCAVILLVSLGSLRAAETNEVQQLRQQLQQMQETFERVQREQKQQIDVLNKKLDDLTRQQAADAEKKKLEQELAADLGTNHPPATASAPAGTTASTPGTSAAGWSPAEPITVARAGSAYMNVSFDALTDFGWSTVPDPSTFLQLGDHDPNARGFSLVNAELVLDGAIDPYFKGFANIVFKLDQAGDTQVELEETYLQTMTLPLNLQVKGGQFLADFGRQNTQHPHQWAFVDDPIILTRAFGPDGLRGIGAQVSWLAPTPFYTEATLGLFNGNGETSWSFRNQGSADVFGVDRFHGRATINRMWNSIGSALFVPRLASSFELTDQQTLVMGVSGAFGPNDTGGDQYTQVYGTDLYWKWKPASAHAGFPFVSWQTEALYQIYGAGADLGVGLPQETLNDYGFYSQVLWGFKERWVAGLRGEWADSNSGAYDPFDVYRGERIRVSPDLTFYPSEFSKIRLQYNYDQGQYFGTAHSIWLQFEFLLGAHAAHKF